MSNRGPGRPSKYPWDVWLDGETRTLIRGEDFDISPASFRNIVLQAADRRDLLVSTSRSGDAVTIRVERDG